MTSHAVTVCPHCRAWLDTSTPAFDPGAVPKEGDASVCAYCTSISVFRADQTLRPMTRAEVNRLSVDEIRQLGAAKTAAAAAPLFGRPPP